MLIRLGMVAAMTVGRIVCCGSDQSFAIVLRLCPHFRKVCTNGAAGLHLHMLIQALQSLLSLDLGGVIACSLGVLMFVLGVLGLFKGSIKACRVIAVIVCMLSAASFVMTLLGGSLGGITTTLVWALLAWVYFDLT